MTKILNLLELMTTPWEPERDRAVRLVGQKSPHFTRSVPGRIHNHSGTEKQFWMFSYPLNQFVRRFTARREYDIRRRLNRFPAVFDKIDRSPNRLWRFARFLWTAGLNAFGQVNPAHG